MRVGILGGGQLARMLALAAHPLGIETLCFALPGDTATSPVSAIIQSEHLDGDKLQTFIQQSDVITYENENIPADIADLIQARRSLFPSPQALKIAQDRLSEKKLFTELGINTAKFFNIPNREALSSALEQTGYPAILKTRRFGYDGKGQFLIRQAADAISAWQALGDQDLILEQFIPFQRELSLIAVRNRQQQINTYPLTENIHEQGILRLSIAPFINTQLQQQAQQYSQRILEHLDYVGILAIEFFQAGGSLLANEMAPRVHNSGHWTLEGAHTSQFENHLRAICDLPLGDSTSKGHSAMFNCISSLPEKSEILAIPYTHFHDYHKQARPQRKLGHITLNTTAGDEAFQHSLAQLRQHFNLANTDIAIAADGRCAHK